MKNYTKVLLGILGLAVLAGVALIWQTTQQEVVQQPTHEQIAPLPPMAAVPQPPAAAPESSATILHPIEAVQMQAGSDKAGLPTEDSEEAQIRRALTELFSSKNILHYVQLSDFVRHVVATVDNLPREHASAALWPVNPIPGRFSAGAGDGSYPLEPTTIRPDNSKRYTPFIGFVESIDAAQAVSLYVRFYPMFQQAYVELGYPKGYFNDRLVAVIDHLLEVPVQTNPIQVTHVAVKGPYPSKQPWVNYEFSDPALSTLSAGQKMLLRTGSANHQRLQSKLAEFRTQVAGPTLPGQPSSAPIK